MENLKEELNNEIYRVATSSKEADKQKHLNRIRTIIKESVLEFERCSKLNGVEDIKHLMLMFREIFGDFENE